MDTTKDLYKSMAIMTSGTLREMVGKVNGTGIKKEDIVCLLKENEQYYLIYYRL